MAKAKGRDNRPPRVRQVVDLVNGLLGVKPWYSNTRPGGRFLKWRLPAGRDWAGLARVVEDLLKEHGAWEDGCVEVVAEKDGARRRLNDLKSGDFFGEVALLHDIPRTATVLGREAGSVWRLERRDFHELLGRYLELEGEVAKIAGSRVAGGHSMAGAA